MQSATRLGIDPGSVRIGIARSAGSLAFPVGVFVRDTDDIAGLQQLCEEYQVSEFIVGAPLSLSGIAGPSVAVAYAYAEQLAMHFPHVVIRLVDERLTTVSAAEQLRRNGLNTKQQRERIDAVAATVLLQHALDTEISTGSLPGRLLTEVSSD